MATESAFADWQYTSWQMTPGEVVAASGGKASLLELPERTQSGLILHAQGDYMTGSFSFKVSFLFRQTDRILDRVVLRLRNTELASQLYQSLIAQYSQPVEETVKPIQNGESHTAKWEDAQNNNVVTYYGIGDIYGIEYAPLTRGGDGL